MARALDTQTSLRRSIEQELARRTRAHQLDIRRLGNRMRAATGAAAPQPLVLLANGDSWFDYPLDGNSISIPLHHTDIVAQLSSLGPVHPHILNLAHYGEATSDEMGLTKQRRMIAALQEPANWPASGRPDAILFSGGGDDIVGNQFCILLNHAASAVTALNEARFRLKLEAIEASYLDLFAFRNRFAPGVPILGHAYDFVIPDGRHPPCVGPWLQPSLQFTGWDTGAGTITLRRVLEEFRSLLAGLAADATNRFVLVDTQGTLSAEDWANELHPHPPGFVKLAARFVDALRTLYPGRI
jgi:hypothetical protein